ncbi:MAG: NAD(+) synthase [Candidatus Gracilibacteria bacterium]|nr:NAD(+) synthase [Candidatus Gracilibacteria bacterium]
MKTNAINIAQIQVFPGNPEKNLKNIIREIKKSDSDLIIFPEMAVPGYFLGDEWENESFVRECHDMNKEIIESTKDHSSAIWGNILLDENKINANGSFRKYNAAFLAQNGEKKSNGVFDGYTIKSLLPNYKQFDDERYFYSLQKLAIDEGKNLKDYLKPFEIVLNGVKRKVGIVICEDMWDENYQIKPIEILKENGSDIIVNISASPFAINKQFVREKILKDKSKNIDLIYANNVGIQNTGKNIFVFDGESAIFQNGEKKSGSYFLENKIFGENGKNLENKEKQEKISQTLVYGIKEFLSSIKQKKVVIGLSGGLDSAIVATLLVQAIGRENVIAVNMPSKFNSNITKNIARNLASDLGIKYIEFPIQNSVDITKLEIEKIIGKEISSLNYENIQSRDRGARVLAGIASAQNAVFTCNGNKTEMALGYATLYGDIAGAFAPIGDLYKNQVYELARYLDEKMGGILSPVIDIIPSAELSEKQNIEEGKGDPFNYKFTDKILYKLIEDRKDLDDILSWFMDGILEEKLNLKGKIVGDYFASNFDFVENLEKIYKLFKINFFKRIQSPPIISLSKRAFGTDFRESQNPIYFTRNYRDLKDKIIKKDKIDEIFTKFLSPEFSQKVNVNFEKIYLKDAGLWEKYSIGTHTSMVLENFEKFFSGKKFPASFDREIFKLILALHDIGKAQAIENEGKEAQHKYTVKIIKNFFDEIGISKKYTKFAIALIETDVIGEYLQDKISILKAKKIIEKRAKKSGFSREIFLEILTIFFRIDAGAYTISAGGFESLDRLFNFDYENMILNFANDVKNKIDEIL